MSDEKTDRQRRHEQEHERDVTLAKEKEDEAEEDENKEIAREHRDEQKKRKTADQRSVRRKPKNRRISTTTATKNHLKVNYKRIENLTRRRETLTVIIREAERPVWPP
ncbi:hypothetical protein ACFQJ8_00970 [Halocatena marina]|uniref:hypothetical protein n=1 Tax=Halocatena marina TaxID=2934937 RepID=UPI00360C0EFF